MCFFMTVGGFNAFARDHADLCSSDNTSPPDNSGTPSSISHARASASSPTLVTSSARSNTSPPRSRLHLGPLPTMVTKPVAGDTVAQTPMIENPNVNPLFESVRQAMGLDTNITEEIPVRLPSGFSIEIIREHLPSWLLNVIEEPEGKTRLAKYFQVNKNAANEKLGTLLNEER